MPIEGGSPKQITFLNSLVYSPVWSPDGTEIAFTSTENGSSKVWRVSVNGGTPRPFDDSELSGGTGRVSWSPGANILYQRPGNRSFNVLDPTTEEESPLVEDDSVGWMFDPQYSPDGKKVAVFWNRSPLRGLWLISLEDSSQAPLHESRYPIGWSSDGNWILARQKAGKEILMIPIGGGEAKMLVKLPFGEIGEVRMTPDGRQFVCGVHEIQSDVWLVENFDPAVR
jgi:Tol biopolymer transport system component